LDLKNKLDKNLFKGGDNMLNLDTYNPFVIILDGVFKGIIGEVISAEISSTQYIKYEIRIDYDNTVYVKDFQIAPFKNIDFFNERGICIYNSNGTFKNGYEILKDMEERGIMPTKDFDLLAMLEYKNITKKNETSNSDDIVDINIIVPNKVVEVIFADGKKEKMVCHEEDTFNLRNCLFIAIAKHLYRDEYTFEGIEWKAFELTYLKKYVKIVDSALKAYDKKQKDIAKLEENYKAEQEVIKRKLAKRQAYKERRAAKREQEEMDKQIAIQREAYLQAMDIIKSENK